MGLTTWPLPKEVSFIAINRIEISLADSGGQEREAGETPRKIWGLKKTEKGGEDPGPLKGGAEGTMVSGGVDHSRVPGQCTPREEQGVLLRKNCRGNRPLD